MIVFFARASRNKKNKMVTKAKEEETEKEDPITDKWKIEPFLPEDNASGSHFLEESSFMTLFPKYREKYLQSIWADVTKAFDKHFIKCELNLIEGSMTVRTTMKTFDPVMILKARDVIKFLARSVPFEQSVKLLQDDVACDIVKISGLVRSNERFIKRRQRLVGPNGNTLKAIELLTGCYILVQGNTVSVMGSYKGLKEVRIIVEDCMKNIHPIYHIKKLMIKQELSKNPELSKEDWLRFLPQFKSNSLKKRKKTKHEKKEYTPFPPAPQKRKIDLQIESGEYFLASKEKKKIKLDAEKVHQQQVRLEREKERNKGYVAPTEAVRKNRLLKKRNETSDNKK